MKVEMGLSDSDEFIVQHSDAEHKTDRIKNVTTWATEYFDRTYQGKDVYAKLAVVDDSLKLVYTRTEYQGQSEEKLIDSLKAANTLDREDVERMFVDSTDEGTYTVIDDLGETAKGTFTVKGSDNVTSTIDMNNHSGFVINSEDKITLKLDNVEITNGNGFVINAVPENAETTIELVDTGIKNTTGNAIQTSHDISVKSVNRDVTFSNNTSDVLLSDSANLNLSANAEKTLLLNSGIALAEGSNAVLNINNEDSTGKVAVHTESNIGNMTDNLANINFNGGSFDTANGIVTTIYTDKLNVSKDTSYSVDVNLAKSTADKIYTPRYRGEGVNYEEQGRLTLTKDNFNILDEDKDINAVKLRLLDIRHATADFLALVDEDGNKKAQILLYSVPKGEGETPTYYYARLGLNGSVIISSDPDNLNNDIVDAIKSDLASVTYNLTENRVLYNWGRDEEGASIFKAQSIQTKKLTLRGNGLTTLSTPTEMEGISIDGVLKDDGSGAYLIQPSKQQINAQNFTVKGFNSAFINNGGKVTLKNVNLIGNETERNGAGVRNNLGTLTIQGTKKAYAQVYNNVATDNGGAISNGINGTEESPVATQTAVLTANYVMFGQETDKDDMYGNDAYIGGAIYTIGKKATIKNSYFIENFADAKGGAIYTETVTAVSGTTFRGNKSALGGAVYVNAIPANKNGITLAGNFYLNNAETGGAVYVEQGKVTINKSNFGSINVTDDGNTATNGGAIYVASKTYSDSNIAKFNVTTVKASNFTNNNAENGGAIYNKGKLTLSKDKFGLADKLQKHYYNTATNGGAIYNTGDMTDTSSTYMYNEATNGGAIYNTGNIVTYNVKTGAVTGGIKSSKFTENKATSGGAIYNKGVIGTTKATFTSNIAQNGGAVYNDTYSKDETGVVKGEITLLSNTFTLNKTTTDEEGKQTGNGGAVYNAGHLVVDKSTFGKASNVNKGLTYFNEALNGGAIYNTYAARVSNTKFIENQAGNQGGAIYTAEKSALVVNGATFTNNSAKQGGAIFAGVNSIVQIADTSFTGNTAGNYGGAIYASEGSEIQIMALKKNVTFTNNALTDGTLEAIYLNSATLKLFADAKRKITINDNVHGSGTIETAGTGTIYISNQAEFGEDKPINIKVGEYSTLSLGDEIELAKNLRLSMNNSTVGIANNKIGTLALKSLSLGDNTTNNLAIDMDLKNGKSDNVTADSTEGSGTLNVNKVNLISDSKSPVSIEVGGNN